MAELNIFQKGDKVKFIVTSQNKNLDMEACDFYVEIVYGMRGNKLTIQKSDMLYGTDGEYVMVIDTTPMASNTIMPIHRSLMLLSDSSIRVTGRT